MKAIFLCLFGIVCGTSGSELYRALNISCHEMKKMCDTASATSPPPKVDCAFPSIAEETEDQCAVLYQLIAPSIACDLASRAGLQPRLRHLYSEWWSNSPLISPRRLSNFVLKIKQSLVQYFLVNFTSSKCFSPTDILESQGLSTKKCFAQSSVGQLCSAIIDRLAQGEAICEDKMFDDVSCVNDAVEQLFDLLAVDNDMLTLTELHTLIGNRLHVDHHRGVREEDHDGDDDHVDEDDHDDDDDDHGHDDDDDHDHDEAAANQNCISEPKLQEEFNHVLEEFMLMDTNGSCFQHANDSDDTVEDVTGDTNCSLVYSICRDLILETQLTTEACLAGNTSTTDHHDDDDGDGDGDDDVSDGEAYGWGFLSTLIISVASQLGVVTILFSYNNQMAKYLMSLLIAVGISTLVSDAILHLIPEAFGAHEEEEEDDGHGHGDEGGHGHDKTTIWRGVCVLVGILLFYLFELVLSLIKRKLDKQNKTETTPISLQEVDDTAKQIEEEEEDHKDTTERNGCLNFQMDIRPPYFNPNQGFFHGISSVAWMIILGDGIHNFADGIAIGASFTSSLGIGVSTSLAVFFHELPHEFGDFAILLSSGMKWYVALMYNTLSAITAIIGMFIGVAIGNASEDSTPWILAITAGVFLYVALVDLLPGLMEMLRECKSQRTYWIYMLCHLTGFMIGFVILLLIAIYEEELNTLVD